MLAYIPYMDPMGEWILVFPQFPRQWHINWLSSQSAATCRIMEWLQHFPNKKQCSLSLIVCNFFGVGFEAKQFWRFNVQSMDTTQDLSIPWPMKIWWSMPSDAWPWWFLNPHENLRNNIIDWYVFLGIHFTVSPEVLSVLVLEPWKGKIHLRTGNLLPPVSSAARNFGQIHFTSQTCPQGQKIRNPHDAVQTGKTPWMNARELCGKKKKELSSRFRNRRTELSQWEGVFFCLQNGEKHICVSSISWSDLPH